MTTLTFTGACAPMPASMLRRTATAKPHPDYVRHTHIMSVYRETGHNMSETARVLGMHRRTLQRIVQKNYPKHRTI